MRPVAVPPAGAGIAATTASTMLVASSVDMTTGSNGTRTLA
jgi:hypothetical protein